MIFLTSPELGDSPEKWEAWIEELQAMPQRDISVKFALDRARRVLAQTKALAAEMEEKAH